MTRSRVLWTLILFGLAAGLLAAMAIRQAPTIHPALSPLGPRSPVATFTPVTQPASPMPQTRIASRLYLPLIANVQVSPPPAVAVTAAPTSVIPNVLIPKNLGGLHVEGVGDHTGYEEFLRACSAANRPVSLIKVFGDGFSARLAKETDPRTVTIWRKPAKTGHKEDMDNPPGDWNWSASETPEIARRWMEAMYPVWENERQYIDYFEIVNEPNMATMTQTLRSVDFMLEAMKLADQHDPPYKLAIWSFSSGTPELWQAQLMVPTLRYAAEHGHILSVHDGSVDAGRRLFRQAAEDGTAFRYRMFYPLLGKSMPRVAVTEAYQPEGYYNPDWADWQWYLTEMAKDDVIGVAWFTLGPYSFGGGQDVNVVKQLPSFAQALGCK